MKYTIMACLQNGSTLLNNNNLSSFKHNIMKYDENHPTNMWSNSSQINSFLNKNCQIPFRNSHTKDKSNIYSKEEMHSCSQDDVTSVKQPSDNETRETNETTTTTAIITQNDQLQYRYNSSSATPKFNTAHDKNNIAKDPKLRYQFMKSPESSSKTNEKRSAAMEEIGWTNHKKNLSDSQVYADDNSYQKGYSSDNQMTINSETEANEPSHHARRPMNAFLIFCKRHRTVVKNRYPHLENRAVTKILGEWWAALETEEKACYTELAKQYKNAFFSANPNFKWYKLPAPPLRTLHTRPGNIVKSPLPLKPSPFPEEEEEEKPRQQQLFTPGKLADETQLGSLSSLINFDSQHQHTNANVVKTTTFIGKNDSDIKPDEQTVLSPTKREYQNYLLSPPHPFNTKLCQPPKPFKKRMLHNHKDNKNIVRSIFCTNDSEKKPERNIFDSSLLEQALENFVDTVNNDDLEEHFGDNTEERPFITNTNSNFTQQEIINKVVDHMCSTKSESNDSNNDDMEDSDCNTCLQNEDSNSKETRKSVRSCKGLRYAKFMAEGKLFVNKRNKKHMSTTKLPKPSYTSSNASDKVPRNTESIELNETIKKLTERTMGNFTKIAKPHLDLDHNDNSPDIHEYDMAHERHKMFRAADFNLDEKIEALPSLSLDKFQQKKKENKKRKFLRATKIKETTEQKKVSPEANRSECDSSKGSTSLTGSRKRKPRKQSITRLDLEQSSTEKQSAGSSAEMDLFGLATLAEVAAKKAKIDQK